MMSQLCPNGVEATMYALLAGASNLGNALAAYEGAYVLDALGVTPNGSPNEGAKFDNLWIAAVLAAMGPCVPLLFLPFLIPDARQTDRLLDDDDGPRDPHHQDDAGGGGGGGGEGGVELATRTSSSAGAGLGHDGAALVLSVSAMAGGAASARGRAHQAMKKVADGDVDLDEVPLLSS